jgi:hypothetical protein
LVMELPSKPSDEVKNPETISVPKGKRKRGMSAWACAYKARHWTLESSKDSPKPKANATEECEPKPTTRTTDA